MVTAVTQNVGNCPGPGFQRAVKRLWSRFFCNFSLAKQRKVFSIRINASAARLCVSPTGFSICFYASACRYSRIPTGKCALELRLYINLSVRCKIFAPTNRRLALNSRTLSSLHRYGHRSHSECRQLSCTGIPKGG